MYDYVVREAIRYCYCFFSVPSFPARTFKEQRPGRCGSQPEQTPRKTYTLLLSVPWRMGSLKSAELQNSARNGQRNELCASAEAFSDTARVLSSSLHSVRAGQK